MAVVVLAHADSMRSRLIGYPTSWEDLMIKIKRFLSLDDLDEDKLRLIVNLDWSQVPLELDSSALPDYRLPDKTEIWIELGTTSGDIADEDDESNQNDKDYEEEKCDEDSVDSEEDEEGDSGGVLDVSTAGDPTPGSSADLSPSGQPFQIIIRSLTGKMRTLLVHSDMTISGVKTQYEIEEGIALGRHRLVHDGSVLQEGVALWGYLFEEGETLDLVLETMSTKSSIYFLTPKTIPNVGLEVRLSDDWHFTARYPTIESSALHKPEWKSAIAWSTRVKNDGTISDRADTMDTKCLFWEAASVLPEDGRVIDQGIFTPNTPNLTPARSRLIERYDIISYLYECLTALCLTPSMRSDFITAWLPKFSELYTDNYDIVLNFVKQTEKEKAANLSFTKNPSAVVRVLMVFGGVPRGSDEHDAFMANQGGPETPEGWRDVVGITKDVVDVMADKTKFRAIECGAMYAVPTI